MYDLSQPNDRPGECRKCKGTGVYAWGGTVNGKAVHSGCCFSCGGTGRQDASDISRNHTYNRFKVQAILAADLR